MIESRSRRAERIQRDESGLTKAGFTGRNAHVLATLNWWIFPCTLIVTVVTLVWIGVHLWPDLDAERWQVWADENTEFFSALDTGATLAIVPELHSHAGLLIRKAPGGVEVERHLWFPFDDVPVGLVIPPEVVDQLLRLHYGDKDFWGQWEALVMEEGISTYQHLGRGSEPTNGYDAFLARLRRSS
jgi:hypothetical protein